MVQKLASSDELSPSLTLSPDNMGTDDGELFGWWSGRPEASPASSCVGLWFMARFFIAEWRDFANVKMFAKVLLCSCTFLALSTITKKFLYPAIQEIKQGVYTSHYQEKMNRHFLRGAKCFFVDQLGTGTNIGNDSSFFF